MLCRSQVADGGDGLQIQRVTANNFKKERDSQTTDRFLVGGWAGADNLSQ
jgi:hypothetical protein